MIRENALKLQDPLTTLAACDSFRFDLLADFPAEVFLQHPSVLQVGGMVLGRGRVES